MFLSAINRGITTADRITLRTRTLYEIEEEFRYMGYDPESDTDMEDSRPGVQEGGTSTTNAVKDERS